MRPDESGDAVRERLAGDIVDAVFAIACPSLPVDHAYALSKAVEIALPWFADEPDAGLHTIHGAASGSGWMRPEGADALLQLSHRARLALRLPAHRFDDATALVGRTLDVAGWRLRVDKVALRPLSRITTLFARSVVLDGEDETAFSAAAVAELDALGIRPARIVCGRTTPLATPARVYETRSLMLAGLTLEESLALQRHGLGAKRKLGCGVFIPHKDIADLRSRSDDL
ncbi:MAG TPA: type I-MYXAN CRISPR-associated protein Cas6/Cmx6 [Casimicrobiaceae bacterium]|jgi:CRISPR-associated protein Cas6|nr:type I-MYXAN CRISPR-associated protein Cas6/Cmx6 [Casimicrobiaceae bacterium]